MLTSLYQMLTCTNCDQLSNQCSRIIIPVVHVHAFSCEQKQTTTREEREKTLTTVPASSFIIADEPRSRHGVVYSVGGVYAHWSLSVVRAYKTAGRAARWPGTHTRALLALPIRCAHVYGHGHGSHTQPKNIRPRRRGHRCRAVPCAYGGETPGAGSARETGCGGVTAGEAETEAWEATGHAATRSWGRGRGRGERPRLEIAATGRRRPP